MTLKTLAIAGAAVLGTLTVASFSLPRHVSVERTDGIEVDPAAVIEIAA